MARERYLRLVYRDKTWAFDKLLQQENLCQDTIEVSQVLSREMFGVYNGISPNIMTEAFPLSQALNYSIRHQLDFSTRTLKSVHYGTELLGFLRSKSLELVLAQPKNAESLEACKSGTEKWKSKECPWRLCKTYIHQVSLI